MVSSLTIRGRAWRAYLAAAFASYLVYFYKYGWLYLHARFVDAPTFWAGAELAFNRSTSPYQPSFSSAASGLAGSYVHPYLYPPQSLLFFYPLAWFSYPEAAVALLLVNHVALIAVGLLLTQIVWPGARENATILALAIVSCAIVAGIQGTRVTLGHGQVNLLVLLLVLGFWAAVKARSSAPLAALPLAIAGAIKVYPLIFLAMLVARRRWSIPLWAAAWSAAFVAASVLFLPDGTWQDWLRNVLPTGGYGSSLAGVFSPAYPENYAISGPISRLFIANAFTDAPLKNPALGILLVYLSCGAILLTTVWTSFRSPEREPEAISSAEFAVYLCAITLTAPISWLHYTVFIAPAAIILTVSSWRAGMRQRAALAAVCLLCLFQSFAADHPEPTSGVFAALATAPQTYVIVLLWAAGVGGLLAAGPVRSAGPAALESETAADVGEATVRRRSYGSRRRP